MRRTARTAAVELRSSTALMIVLPSSKSLSDNLGSTKGDIGASEMEHRQVVLRVLLPPDEQSAEAVHPGMGALDHPAPRPVARDPLLVRLLLAPGADMSGVAVGLDQLSHLIVAVPLIQTGVP